MIDQNSSSGQRKRIGVPPTAIVTSCAICVVRVICCGTFRIQKEQLSRHLSAHEFRVHRGILLVCASLERCFSAVLNRPTACQARDEAGYKAARTSILCRARCLPPCPVVP